MICYKNKTFCGYYKGCKDGKDCTRALTSQIIKQAEIFGLGVAVFTEEPFCYRNKKSNEKDKETNKE